MSTYALISDEELAELLRMGDEKAFAEIHNRFYSLLFRHAYGRLNDKDDVQDLLQELFVYLWDNRAVINFHHSVKSYLYGATRNRILNIYKSKRVRSDYIDSLRDFISEGEFFVDESFRTKELTILVEKEVAKLPAQMRSVFEMSRNLGMSHKEIAEKLNISPLTVKKQVQNSLRILKVKLGSAFFTVLF